MNEDTLVVVHCYAGDADLVRDFMPQYVHHECPVLVLSPEDAPVRIEGVECRSAGQAGYFGQGSLDRQREHLKLLLEYPQTYFLLNDADSFCLSPELPAYLYENAENTIWSTEVRETRPHPSPYPKIAFHPPYFLTRQTIEKLLAVGPIEAHPITPFIDWMMVALASEAGVEHRSYPDGRSFPAWKHGAIPETKELGHNYVHRQEARGVDGARRMAQQVLRGAIFIHSVKHPEVRDQLVAAYGRRRRQQPRAPRPPRVRPSRVRPAPPAPAGEPPPDSELSILVAFRDDSESQQRAKLWAVIQDLLERELPEAEVVVGTDDGVPFCKTAALNRAAARATGKVFYILDADSWVPAAQVRQAHHWVSSGRAWAKPWGMKIKLGPEATARILASPWDGSLRPEDRRKLEHRGPYQPAPPLLVSREAFDEVGGLDERFKGWGSEDVAFAQSLSALFGTPKVIRGACIHLNHDRIGRSGRDLWPGQKDYQEAQPLIVEYRRASRSAEAMRRLIAERLEDVPTH
jgi:hypothetical protein